MPAESEKQRRFMGAELARKRAGKKTKTGMTEGQLKDFATMKKAHAKMPKSHMPKGGKLKGAWGDVGALRQEESVRMGGFKAGATVKASSAL